jgi:hypothetical protein
LKTRGFLKRKMQGIASTYVLISDIDPSLDQGKAGVILSTAESLSMLSPVEDVFLWAYMAPRSSCVQIRLERISVVGQAGPVAA